MNKKKAAKLFLKGTAMGIADIIPGVSGGTVAFITGIYERLVFGIKNIDFKFIPLALKGDLKGAKKNFFEIDLEFFVPLLTGLGISFLLFARIVKYFLEFFPVETFSFFTGLILASALVIFKKTENKTPGLLVFIALGLIFGFVISTMNPVQADHSPLTIIASGVVAITAMILPGVSGAFLLLLLGQYEFIIEALHSLDFFTLALFQIGTISGIIVFSRLLAYLLKKHKTPVFGFLTGLMIGGLAMPLNKVSTLGDGSLLVPVTMAITGIVLVLLLEFFSDSKCKKF